MTGEADRTNNDLHRDIGKLDGRLTAVENDQAWIKGKLMSIDNKLSWLLGVLIVVSTLASAAGWAMVTLEIPPFDVEEQVEEKVE